LELLGRPLVVGLLPDFELQHVVVCYDSSSDDSHFGGEEHECYESRGVSLIRLLKRGWRRLVPTGQLAPGTQYALKVSGEDRSRSRGFTANARRGLIHNTCYRGEESVPTFMMDAWPHVGVRSFAVTRTALVRAGQGAPTNPRAFWAGAKTHPLRIDMLAWSANHTDLADLDWQRTDPNGLAGHTPTYVSLQQHAEYAVLVDAPRRELGLSARLPLLLATVRPVVVVDRPDDTELLWRLQPWIHYIPANLTLDSVTAAVRWAVADHPAEVAAIGRAGQDAVLRMTTPDALDAWTAQRMLRWAIARPNASPMSTG